LLAAISGGADSTALLLALHSISQRSGTALLAAHFDHHLRPGSAQDADAVARLCASLGVPPALGGSDVRARARRTGASLETAARDARYDFLAREARRTCAQGVATGHTTDDQAETVLLHLVRGSGARGLAGMKPATERSGRRGVPRLTVMRPMLHVRHADAVAYCEARGVEPLSDPSNEDLRHSRNLVRHEVIPLLERLNPHAAEAIARLAGLMADDIAALEFAAAGLVRPGPAPSEATVDRSAILGAGPGVARYSLRRAFEIAAGSADGLTSRHIEAMLSALRAGAGRQTALPNGFHLSVTHSAGAIAPTNAEAPCPFPPSVPAVSFSCPGARSLPGGFTISARPAAHSETHPRGPWEVEVAAAALSGPLVVRSRRPGDRFHPLGMPAPAKLQDFLVNQHVRREWRDRVPVIESGRGIVWLAGLRIAEWAKVPAGGGPRCVLELRSPAPQG
jgi:tRNA(Ile)-lysidine synthase